MKHQTSVRLDWRSLHGAVSFQGVTNLLQVLSHGKTDGSEVTSYLFEVSVLALLPVHHVVEDGDHDVPHLHLRDQRHSQERADHSGDEVDLVLACTDAVQIKFLFHLVDVETKKLLQLFLPRFCHMLKSS